MKEAAKGISTSLYSAPTLPADLQVKQVTKVVQFDVKAALADAQVRMRDAGLPENVVENFTRLFFLVAAGESGAITENEIEPANDIPSLNHLLNDDSLRTAGERALGSLAVLRLNGGLGTSMGLARAKSLLRVKESLSFNDIIANQVEALGRSFGVQIPLVHMTSFATDADIKRAMSEHSRLEIPGIPSTFLQHKHPKIYVSDLHPASEVDEDLNWNPPGHGDLYAALVASGIGQKLLTAGKRYVFVANADNLGATVDPIILGYMVSKQIPFLMETATRTLADSKGGHLARRRTTGRLILREVAQAPTLSDGSIAEEFGDITLYRHFNTNNIWLDLEEVLSVAKRNGGFIPLPLISNRKTVNPRNRSSRAVYQLETAMGAAIEVFEKAAAMGVPRSRFAPVKSNNDLLLVLSDLYELDDLHRLNVSPDRLRHILPQVSLDPAFFSLIADFDERIKVIPSLKHCATLHVHGDVDFISPLAIVGDVKIINRSNSRKSVPADVTTLQDEELILT